MMLGRVSGWSGSGNWQRDGMVEPVSVALRSYHS